MSVTLGAANFIKASNSELTMAPKARDVNTYQITVVLEDTNASPKKTKYTITVSVLPLPTPPAANNTTPATDDEEDETSVVTLNGSNININSSNTVTVKKTIQYCTLQFKITEITKDQQATIKLIGAFGIGGITSFLNSSDFSAIVLTQLSQKVKVELIDRNVGKGTAITAQV